VRKYCYVASARRRARRWGAHGERRGAGAYCVATRTTCFITRSTGRPQTSDQAADPAKFLLLPLSGSGKNFAKNSQIGYVIRITAKICFFIVITFHPFKSFIKIRRQLLELSCKQSNQQKQKNNVVGEVVVQHRMRSILQRNWRWYQSCGI